MKIITIASIYLVSCLLSSAADKLHSIYYENSRTLVSFLKTDNENQIECIRVCILNEANQFEAEIYAQSASHNGQKWILNNGSYTTFDVVKNEPVRIQKFKIKTLNELPSSLNALHRRNDEFIIYLPNYQVFIGSLSEKKGIHFISYLSDGKIRFMAAKSYSSKESKTQLTNILTLINGTVKVVTETSFTYPLQALTFSSMDIELPLAAFELLQLNQLGNGNSE